MCACLCISSQVFVCVWVYVHINHECVLWNGASSLLFPQQTQMAESRNPRPHRLPSMANGVARWKVRGHQNCWHVCQDLLLIAIRRNRKNKQWEDIPLLHNVPGLLFLQSQSWDTCAWLLFISVGLVRKLEDQKASYQRWILRNIQYCDTIRVCCLNKGQRRKSLYWHFSVRLHNEILPLHETHPARSSGEPHEVPGENPCRHGNVSGPSFCCEAIRMIHNYSSWYNQKIQGMYTILHHRASKPAQCTNTSTRTENRIKSVYSSRWASAISVWMCMKGWMSQLRYHL